MAPPNSKTDLSTPENKPNTGTLDNFLGGMEGKMSPKLEKRKGSSPGDTNKASKRKAEDAEKNPSK